MQYEFGGDILVYFLFFGVFEPIGELYTGDNCLYGPDSAYENFFLILNTFVQDLYIYFLVLELLDYNLVVFYLRI